MHSRYTASSFFNPTYISVLLVPLSSTGMGESDPHCPTSDLTGDDLDNSRLEVGRSRSGWGGSLDDERDVDDVRREGIENAPGGIDNDVSAPVFSSPLLLPSLSSPRSCL
jgi:hypothetical protein